MRNAPQARAQRHQQLRQLSLAGLEPLQVLGVGALHTQRLAPLARLHRSLVDAAAQFVQALAEAPEALRQLEHREGAQIGAARHPHGAEALGGRLAHAEDASHRQRRDEGIDLLGQHHEIAVGLVPVAGHLGQELVRRHPRGDRDADLGAHAPTDVARDQRGAAMAGARRAHVEEGFVQRQRLHQVGVVVEDLADLARGGAVLVEIRRQDHQPRAEPARMRRGHRRMHAVFARHVVAGGDHAAALGTAADRNRQARQRGVVADLDRRVEAVAIAVDDLALDLDWLHAKPRLRRHLANVVSHYRSNGPATAKGREIAPLQWLARARGLAYDRRPEHDEPGPRTKHARTRR